MNFKLRELLMKHKVLNFCFIAHSHRPTDWGQDISKYNKSY